MFEVCAPTPIEEGFDAVKVIPEIFCWPAPVANRFCIVLYYCGFFTPMFIAGFATPMFMPGFAFIVLAP